MSTLIVNNKKINYVVHGDSGDYLIMVNGLMMTTNSWLHMVPELKKHFRVVCVDMHDMGASEKMDCNYKNEIQCDVIKGVIEAIGAKKAHLCGTSYGGTVSLMFALKYPNLVDKIMVFNTLAYADAYLTEVGRLWQKGAATYDCDKYYDEFAPFIYAPWYFEKYHKSIYERKELVRPIISKEYCDSIIRLSKSAEGYDLRDNLKNIKAQVLIVGADQDILTPLSQQYMLAEQIPNAEFVIIPKAGHGAVFEKTTALLTLMVGWFRNIDAVPVFKE